MEWRAVLSQSNVHGDDEFSTNDFCHLCPADPDVYPSGFEIGYRQRNHNQQRWTHQLRFNLLKQLRKRDHGYADRRGSIWIHICRVERSLLRHVNLYVDNELLANCSCYLYFERRPPGSSLRAGPAVQGRRHQECERSIWRAIPERRSFPRVHNSEQRLWYTLYGTSIFPERYRGSARHAWIPDYVPMRAIAAAGFHPQLD